MNMTPTTANQVCNRQYTDTAIVELHRMAATRTDVPSRREIVEALATFVALDPAATLYDLFVALRRLGVSMSIVESVLAHLEMAADEH